MKNYLEEKLKEIEKFYDNNSSSILLRAKRCDNDVKFLLNLIYTERSKYEKEIVHPISYDYYKNSQIELNNSILEEINNYYDIFNNLKSSWDSIIDCNNYINSLLESKDNEKIILGKILSLIKQFYCMPVPCGF